MTTLEMVAQLAAFASRHTSVRGRVVDNIFARINQDGSGSIVAEMKTANILGDEETAVSVFTSLDYLARLLTGDIEPDWYCDDEDVP